MDTALIAVLGLVLFGCAIMGVAILLAIFSDWGKKL